MSKVLHLSSRLFVNFGCGKLIAWTLLFGRGVARIEAYDCIMKWTLENMITYDVIANTAEVAKFPLAVR